MGDGCPTQDFCSGLLVSLASLNIILLDMLQTTDTEPNIRFVPQSQLQNVTVSSVQQRAAADLYWGAGGARCRPC